MKKAASANLLGPVSLLTQGPWVLTAQLCGAPTLGRERYFSDLWRNQKVVTETEKKDMDEFTVCLFVSSSLGIIVIILKQAFLVTDAEFPLFLLACFCREGIYAASL